MTTPGPMEIQSKINKSLKNLMGYGVYPLYTSWNGQLSILQLSMHVVVCLY